MNSTSQRPSLLMVDDRKENLFVLEKLLKPLDVNLYQATSGDAALKLALEQELDLILLDVQMPELDGYQLLELMQAEARLSKIPVIFMTAYYKDETHRLKGYELGAIDYLYKPLDERILLSKIRVFLELFRQKHERHALQHRYQLILDSAGEGIFGVDAEGIINFSNPAAAVMLSRDSAELIGQPVKIILLPEAYANQEYTWKNTDIYKISSQTYFHRVNDSVFLKANHEVLPVDYVLTSILDENDHYAGAVIIFSDASQRKQHEETLFKLQQAHKMEAIGQLTGGIAHDFNNLLMAIQGNLELLSTSEQLTERDQKHIKTALGCVQNSTELTKRLLASARKQVLFPDVVNIKDAILNTAVILKPSLGEAVEINTSFADDLWLSWVDVHQLETAIMNLAINGRDAMVSGGKLNIEVENITITDTTTAGKYQITPGDYVKIMVSDEGTGMSEDIRCHLFEPFFTTKPCGKGTGLGLSMIYGFIKQSKGHITVYSEEGYGTTFNLYLPRATEAQLQHNDSTEVEPTIPPVKPKQKRTVKSTSKRSKTSVAGLDSSRKTILVVEDEDAVRNVAVEYLKGLNYQVLEASNAITALEVLKKEKNIDLLFTDIIMPGKMTGLELAETAMHMYPQLKMLFASGYPKSALTNKFHLSSADQHIVKPYKLATLAERILKSLTDNENKV